MKNKIFSPALYLEGLKQCRAIGWPFAALTALLLVISLGEYSYGLSILVWIAIISIFIVTPLLCLTLFHYLNARSGSDYYHSIPVSRTKVFTSYTAAVYTWAVVPALLYILVLGCLALICSIGFDWSTALELLGINLLCCLQMMGAVMLAMSISSTVVSQITVAGLILLLPRALVQAFISAITTAMPILVDDALGLGWVLSNQLNLVYSLSPLGILFGGTASVELTLGSGIYSFVHGAVLIALAVICFNRKRSETAVSSAPNVYVQTAVRVFIAMVFCIIPCGMIASDVKISAGDIFNSSNILWYGLALIAYFVYEIISQRGVRGVARVWKSMVIGLAVLVILNVAFIGTSSIASRIVLSQKPAAEEIASVSFFYDGKRMASYEELSASNVKLTEPELIELVAHELENNISQIEKFGRNGVSYAASVPVDLLVELDNGGSIVRSIYFEENSYNKLCDILAQNEEIMDICTSYPYDETTECVCVGLTQEDAMKVYEMYMSERGEKEQAIYELFNLSLPGSGEHDVSAQDVDEYIADISVHGTINGKFFYSDYIITTDTPRTANLYLSMLNNSAEAALTEVISHPEDYVYMDVVVEGRNLYDDEGNYLNTEPQYYYFVDGNLAMNWIGADWEKIYDELTANADVEVDITKPFFRVKVSTSDEDGYYADYVYYIQANDENSVILDMIWVG